jgi:hypothetical protein
MMRLLIAALLAVTLLLSLGSTIIAPGLNMFSAPALTTYSTGFNQISPSQIGNTPILLAPSYKQLLTGGQMGSHFKPKLMTNNWTSSMKQSQVNQMFAVLAHGIGSKDVP